MTKEEQLLFCNRCINRKIDMKKGLVCGLTNEKASFQDECPDYLFDETRKELATIQINAFAKKLLMNSNTPMAVKHALRRQGLDEETIESTITNATLDIEREISRQKKSDAYKKILFGALWCAGGLIVTAVTYYAAIGGGTYVVAWGAIIYGAFQFIKGINDLL